jgi:large-conductance mechanosensitive channel
VNNSFEARNKLRTGIEISDKEISQFVVTLIMPLFAFAFNGEFSLKDMVRVIVHACSQMISIEYGLIFLGLVDFLLSKVLKYHLLNTLERFL